MHIKNRATDGVWKESWYSHVRTHVVHHYCWSKRFCRHSRMTDKKGRSATRHKSTYLTQKIHQLSLSFITPLCTQDDIDAMGTFRFFLNWRYHRRRNRCNTQRGFQIINLFHVVVVRQRKRHNEWVVRVCGRLLSTPVCAQRHTHRTAHAFKTKSGSNVPCWKSPATFP